MKFSEKKQSRAGIFQNHIRYWLLAALFVYLFNWLGGKPPNIWALLLLMVMSVLLFYTITGLLRRFARTEHIILPGLCVLAAFCGILLIIYVVLYELQGFHLFHKDNESFHAGKFIQSGLSNFMSVLFVALVYHRQLQNQAKQRALDEASRKQLEAEKLRLETERKQQQTELEMLAAQLDSHWLHSILNHLHGLFAHHEKASAVVTNLISYLKSVFEHSGKTDKLVTIEKEISLLKNHIILNGIAYPGSIPPDLHINGELVARRIPRFTWCTLFENAVKFGDSHDPDHPIRITVRSTHNELVFCCRNKIDGEKKDIPSTKVGIRNVEQQLALSGCTNYTLHKENDGRFFSVTLIFTY